MEVKIKLNDMNYRYDVYHMVNIFYSFFDIKFVDKDWDFYIEILNEKINILNEENKLEIFLDSDLTHKEGIKKAIFEYFTKITKKDMPWGSLIGIRPSKKALLLIEEGKDYDYIVNYFKKNFHVREDKARLCIEVANIERELVNKDAKTISIYIGMPFCPTRCLYCSFTSNPIESCKNMVNPYLEALFYDIEATAKYVKDNNLKIQCVYFGGGTPTSVSDEQFEKTMQHIYESFILNNNIREFTVECGRPDSITLSKLESMKRYNVDRISINPQTMNNDTLKVIGRIHTVEDIIDKFNMARKCGMENINMDIIVGLPGEDLAHIKNTCEEILKLNPESITVHGMSIKRGSRLHENIINKQKVSVSDQHELNLMYEETAKLAEKLKMKPYYMYRQKNMVGNMENVGYTKEGKEGLYNIQMMEERQTIISCGADAVTKVVFMDENRIERHFNLKDVKEYTNRVKEMVEKKINILDTLYKV
ncbi:coproporphyrinogen III oxidase [Clostridium sp. DJ247]|uniref:coproporphyrinogen III oxidase n=1 Tax=Clostridium sp. DJ247 TaxID=2726188 RepID=UPI0016270964|nr:coproporphyrinogen III oxidase [Clostridium sp. DJ247]MBC2581139.1 coproporphyrinogen III oxidase [Clostridium sp. DJ247]